MTQSRNLAAMTLAHGGLLTAIGLGGYFGTGRRSLTALIPALIGGPTMGLGAVALLSKRARPVATRVALALAGVGAAGASRGLPKLSKLLAGEPVERPAAAIAQGLVFFQCKGYLALAGSALTLGAE